jgi:hypothetical protein
MNKSKITLTKGERRVLDRALKTELFVLEEQHREATVAKDIRLMEVLRDQMDDCVSLVGILLPEEAK